MSLNAALCFCPSTSQVVYLTPATQGCMSSMGAQLRWG